MGSLCKEHINVPQGLCGIDTYWSFMNGKRLWVFKVGGFTIGCFGRNTLEAGSLTST